MASLTEILDVRRNSGLGIPDRVEAVTSSAPGATEHLYTNNVLDSLGTSYPWITQEIERTEADMPSLKMFFRKLDPSGKELVDDPKTEGGKEKKDRKSAYDKFIELYPRKKKDWKEAILKDPKLGQRAWDTLESEWRRGLDDKFQKEVEKARYDAVNDGSVSGFLTRTLFPRTTERLANTGEFQGIGGKDMLMDVGENLAMSIPGTGFVKGARIGIGAIPKYGSRIISSAGKAAETLRNARLGAIPWAGKAVANTAGNTVVPLVTELVDDRIYEPGEGMDDRAEFSAGDVAVGGAVNQAVHLGLVRAVAPYIDRYSGELKAFGARKMRDFFNTLGRSEAAIGDDFARGVRDVMKEPVVRVFPEGERITANELNSITQGVNIIPEGVTFEEFLDKAAKERVINMIDDGTLTMRDAKTIAKNIGKNQNKKVDVLNAWKNHYKDLAAEAAANGDNANATANIRKAIDLDMLVNSGKTIEGAKPSQIIRGTATTGDVSNRNALLPEEVREIFQNNPELYNYTYWHGQGSGSAGKLDKVQNAVHQAWPSLVINKLGKSQYAPEVVRVFNDDIEENRNTSAFEGKKNQVSKVLEAGTRKGTLTAEDQKYLADIAKNPDILLTGHKTEPDKFKLWLLMGGNDLLRGTSAHRPLWEVE